MNDNSLMVRKSKQPGGRPTAYRVELCDRVIEAMAGGLSSEAAAAKVGISARSLFNWQREHPEFLQAIREGRLRCLLWWEERALEMAQGKPGNTSIVSLGLRNRSRSPAGWLDNHRLEHSGPDDSPIVIQQTRRIDISKFTEGELDAIERFLRASSADGGKVRG